MRLSAAGLEYTYAVRGRAGEPAGVHAIQLEVAGGDVVSVLGPNGSGKSTLLRLLAGIVAPQAGRVRFGESERPVRRAIGYLPDEAAHFDALTGRENLTLLARAAGSRSGAVDTLLGQFGLAEVADQAVRTYSFGMRRKLAICETLQHTPPLLVLDEPTLGLDAGARDTLAAELSARAANGATVVLATNDLPFAEQCSDRVLFLERGRVVLEGEPRKLMAGAAGSTLEITLAGANGSLPPIPGAEIIARRAERLVLRVAGGAAAIPAILQSFIDHGYTPRALTIRESDLRDAFARVTGEVWTDVEPKAVE